MHNPIKIGVIHGHQSVPTGDLDALSAIARQMDVDVLVSGHTHSYVVVLWMILSIIKANGHAGYKRWNTTIDSS